MWSYCFSHVGNPSAKCVSQEKEALKLFKEREKHMKWFALRFNFIRRGDHTLLTRITHSVNKMKKWIQKTSHQRNDPITFESIFSVHVTTQGDCNRENLEKGIRSQWHGSSVSASSPVVGIFRTFCFCFCSGFSKLTMRWKHLLSCVVA